MSFYNEFKVPKVKNRIKPFWFWNGDMNEVEIKKQIDEMKDKGLGGAFICARQGLSVPYLSKKWFELVKYACDYAKSIGLENWLYDEYPYPSGMSGGEVLLENPDAVHTLLRTYKFYEYGDTSIYKELSFSKILYAKAFKEISDDIYDYKNPIDLTENIGNLQTEEIYQKTGLTKYNNKRFFSYNPTHILDITLPKGKYKIEIFTQEKIQDFKYFGNYFDPCNKDAVDSFLNTTHEKYKKYLGQEFGENIFGMFSDETGLLSEIPWSKEIIKFFKDENGYDLLEVLPALTNNDFENAFKIRYDFMQSIHKLFVDSYHKNISKWCSKNNLLYATEVPSMRLSTQRHSDVIGGDACHEKLGKSLEWIYDNYLKYYRSNVKAVTSVARQLNKQYAMIESFHSIGWTMTISDAKAMIDYMGINGINLFNFHAFYYTINAIIKHDAPPSQFLQNPYWKHYKTIADYTSRISVFNTYNTADTKIAMLDPVASLFTRLSNPFHAFRYFGDDEKERKISELIHKSFIKIAKTILFQQLDFDYLDAEIFRDAKIFDGKIILGKTEYSVLVIPPSETIESFATNKIKEFLDCGGKVIFVGQLPNIIIDKDEDILENYIKISQHKNAKFIESENILTDNNAIFTFINTLNNSVDLLFKVDVNDEYKKNLITSIRKGENSENYIFISNQSSKVFDVNIIINDKNLKYAIILNFENGEKYKIDFNNNVLPIKFNAYESYCIEFSENEQNGSLKVFNQNKNIYKISTNEKMNVSINSENIYRFEYFDFSLDKINFVRVDTKTLIEQLEESILMDREKLVGSKLINGEILSFRSEFGTPKKIYIDYPLNLYYKANFTVNKISDNMNLLMDKNTITSDFIIKINDNTITKNDFKSTFINDQNNIIADIRSYIKTGDNEILIEVIANKDSDGVRDIVYLSGDFGVVMGDYDLMEIDEMPKIAEYTNTFTEGFPFYSGITNFSKNIILSEEDVNNIDAFNFDFENSRYECIELIVNGKNLGVRTFAPYVFDVDKSNLKVGENKITLSVTNSLANMLDGTYFDYETHNICRISRLN